MNIHFIAVGGSVMHNLAIALHKKGMKVTGSDDAFHEPSKGRLDSYGLLPKQDGWDENRVHTGLDGVVLGMHARKNNPELLKAQELGIKIYSFPEYIYEQSKNKKRVVIGGSHGKTSITAMIMHVLMDVGMDFDYMVGAQLAGFETMVRLTKDAPVVILEGDEYLSSPLDLTPKFHRYLPNIAVLSGIAWDHINVFPTFEGYVDQFDIFIKSIGKEGVVYYCDEDKDLVGMINKSTAKCDKVPYNTPPSTIKNGITSVEVAGKTYELSIFGDHNLQNLNAARNVCLALDIDETQFYKSISSFTGAAKRLELLGRKNDVTVYKDFAHSPSKLGATTSAVRKQFIERKLVACMEIHTFSSLNKDFLIQYKGKLDGADTGIVFYSPTAIAHKQLPPLTEEIVKEAFGENVLVFDDTEKLKSYLLNLKWENSVLLMMSSGNFGGVILEDFAEEVLALA
ncbi:MAG: peptidoglycan synthetase [Flavobacteriales bacterium]|nr:peptidoglycan synthetase [Flavobacteriales bacterium]